MTDAPRRSSRRSARLLSYRRRRRWQPLRYRSRLLATVEAFVGHDASVPATAASLFVHANTVRKRLSRVKAIVGLDALAEGDRIALAVALTSRR